MTGFNISDVSDHIDALRKDNKELKAKVEAAKAILQEWFTSENWDESYDHEVLCRLDIVLNDRKTSSSISQEQKASK